jgi:putative ABC transport system ATP-binding protein
VISLRDLRRSYVTPAGRFEALSGISLDVAAGEFVAIVGRSGSGKTTLLNMLAGIDRPTSGRVHVAGRELNDLSNDALASWRGRNVGIVFQFFQLLPTLSVSENVMLPMDLANAVPRAERTSRAARLLDRVGVADQADKLPATLSGGQQQRVAIARALANDPPLLLADEPTGNLDSATGADVFALFGSLAAEGKTVVVVTHERDSITGVRRTVALADGALA